MCMWTTNLHTVILSYYNKRNAHFDVQELLFQFWTERRKSWQEYGEAYRERNIAEPKFELKSFRPNSCVFYGRGRI